jgi:hypothetical protein
MSRTFDEDLFDEKLFDEPDSGGGGGVGSFLSISVDGTDVTDRLVLGNEIASRLTIDQTQEGSTGQLWLNYSDLATLPPVGARFVFTLFSGGTIVLQARTVSKVAERYHDPSLPLWIHEFDLIDPLSALNSQKLPALHPMVDSTTGAIFSAVIAAMDPTLVLNLAAGSVVGAVNFHEFSTFSDLRRSEIVGAGYVLRMEGGLNVHGALDTAFTAHSDWKIDNTDPRYTPSRFQIAPPNELITSVKVVPSKEVPTHRTTEVHELDGRVMPGVALEGNVFGLADAEPFKLTSGADISDINLWQQTGSIGMSGSHILLNGTLVNLDARPFIFPFMTSWGTIIPDEGTVYQFGFQDGNGNWIMSVSSGDYPLIQSVGDDQHIYEIFTLPIAGGSIEIWGYHLHQNFGVDDSVEISTVQSVDYATSIVTLTSPWNIDNTYIRFVDPILGTERGRSQILRRSGAVLTVDALPPGILAGDPVTRGVAADSVITITHIKTVSVGANGGYGLPAIFGSGVHLQAFIVQRTGQIEGYLLSEFNSMPDQVYPRALRLDVDASEISDGIVAGSGSSATVQFSTKFSTEKRLLVALNYVVGGKKDFDSTCGAGGGHLVVPIANEQDPATLQAIANRLCALGSTNNPRVTSNMESPLIAGVPLPFDPLPLNVAAPYRVSVPSVPILSSKLTLEGVSDYYQQEVLLWDIDAGDKTPAERAQEEALRGTVLSKYPIRIATIQGPRITNVSWDDVTLSASISGAGTIYGPKGQVLNIGGGINPAAEAGIADPNSAPITLRCTTDTGNPVSDVIIFQLVYPPKPVLQESVTCHYSALTNLVTYRWVRPSGGIGFDIQRLLDPEGDGTFEYTQIARQTSNTFALPYEPNSKKIKVRAVGLCDKFSGPFVELDCILPALPAPTTFSLVKIKGNGVAILRVSPAPRGKDITGRAKVLRVWVHQTTDPLVVIDSRDDFVPNNDAHYDFVPPPEALAAIGATNWRVHVPFDDTDANDIVWVAACWVDGFGDEGPITVPFDATNPPVTVGSISVVDFWQSPNPGPANGLANRALGGTIEDDNDETTQVEFTAVQRVHLGQNNSQIRLKEEESLPDPAHGYATGPWGESSVFHQVADVSDVDLDNGYVDIEFKQYFRDGKKKHRTYRPTKIAFIGPKVRERGVNNDEATRETVYLVGYDSGVESAPPIVKYQVDGVFDKSLFQFHPGVAGLANNLLTVILGRIDQLDNGFVYHWPRLEGVEVRRYVLLIHTAAFGTRGPGTPGTDPNLVADLNALVDQGQVRVYDVANTVFGTVVQAVDLGDVKKHRFDNGADVIGSITVTAGVTYFVTVIAQTFNGRWSVNFSTILNTTSGQPVSVGDPAPPGPVLNLSLTWKEAIGYKIKFERPTVNSTSIQYYWAVLFDDTGGPVVYMDPETGLAMTGGTTETQARFQVAGTGHQVRVRRATMTAAFVTHGVKLKIWAVNLVSEVLTEALVGDRITTGFVLPGSDAGGPAIDAGPPDIPTANLKFRDGNLVAKLFAGANNWESVYDIEIGLYYPSSANGTTVARNFFDPDTGVDTGVWSTALRTATFGVGGNSGFFTGGRSKFIGKVTKATLPAGAITGGIAIVARGYNKTQVLGGDPVATTNPSTSAVFAIGTALATLALGSTDTDFSNDRDAANWVNSGAAATAVQAALSLIITKKNIWSSWAFPIHLISSPDDVPHPVKYGYKLRAGNDSNNWLDPRNPGTPITVDANAEQFTTTLESAIGTMRSDMAAVFQTNGLKLAVRAYVYVNGTLTPGPFTQYTSAVSVTGDPIAADTAVPGNLLAPTYIYKKEHLRITIPVEGITNQTTLNDLKVVVYSPSANKVLSPTNYAGVAAAQEGTNRFECGLTGSMSINILRSDLVAAFGTLSDTLQFYYYAFNSAGGAGSAATTAIAISTLAGDNVAKDIAVPSSLSIPILKSQPGMVICKNMYAAANNAEHQYTEVVFKVVDNATPNPNVLGYIDPQGGGSPAYFSATEVRTNIGKSGHYNLPISRAQLIAAFGGPTGKNLRAYFYVWNKIGPSDYTVNTMDSLSLPFSSIATDQQSEDSTFPGGLAAPILIAKKDGILAKGIRATTNNRSMLYDELVIEVVDDNGNPITGKPLYLDPASSAGGGTSTEADARMQVADGNNKFIQIRKNDLVTTWGADAAPPLRRNLRPYYYATNLNSSTPFANRGIPAAPPSPGWLPFASLGVDSLGGDTAAVAAPGAPQVIPRSESIKVKVPSPSSNFNQLIKAEAVARVKNVGGGILGYIQDTAAGPAFSAGEFKNDIGPNLKDMFNWSKTAVVALFTAPTTIEFYFYITNGFGSSVAGTPTVLTISTWSADSLAGDLAAPSGLNPPTIDWTAAGRLRVRGMFATTDIHTQKKKYLVIYNGSSTYLDIVNRTTAANEAAARFEIGLKSHVVLADIKKKIYKTVFGAGPVNFFAYWYAENDVNISAPSAPSNAIDVSTINEILSDNRDSVNVVDIGVTLLTTQNHLLNGDFLYDSGIANELNAWLKGNLGGTTAVITTASTGVFWDPSAHAVKWVDGVSMGLIQNLKRRLTPNDFFCITFLAKTAGAFGAGTLNVAICNADGSLALAVGAGINLSLLNSSYQLFGAVFQTDNVSDFTANKFLRLTVSGPSPALDATNNIILDKLMLIRGKQGAAFAARSAAYEGPATAPGNSENISVTPSGTATGDVGNPSGGTQGGWVGPGFGDRILPGTL